MKVAYRKAFLKQLAKIPSSKRASIEQFAFEASPRGMRDGGLEAGSCMLITGYLVYESFQARHTLA